jgi:hypothetical protein
MKESGRIKEIYAAISPFPNENLPISRTRTGKQHILDYRFRIGAM